MLYRLDDLCSNACQKLTLGYLLTVVASNATITYGEIADRLRVDLSIDGRVFPTHIGLVVGTLMEHILEVVPSAPLINLLVVNQRTMQPSKGADGFLRKRYRLTSRTIPKELRREIVAKGTSAVYAYPGWPNIYRQVFRTRAPDADPASLVVGTEIDRLPPSSLGNFGGPAESREHRRLKHYVYAHPDVIGAPSQPNRLAMELLLRSGDEVDVFLEYGNIAHLIEVKSVRSSERDLERGIYQCVKYRAVFKAQRRVLMPDLSVRVTLVTEVEPSQHIRALGRLHGVRCKVVAVNSL